jgi:hypothetical protein
MSPIDTAKKRKGASGEQDPQPDGTIDVDDRGQVAGEYVRGVTLSPPAPGLTGGFKMFGEGGCVTFKTT